MTDDTKHFEYLVVLDFEATCDLDKRPQPQEIIEFPSVLMSLPDCRFVDEFVTFVRPAHHPRLSEFCRSLTSIRQVDVDKAPTFPQALKDYENWLAKHGLHLGNALVATCGDWDLGIMLPAQCDAAEPRIEWLPPLLTRWQNVKVPFAVHTGRDKAPGMPGMLDALGLALEGHHHRGIDDCRNIAAICRELVRGGRRPAVTASLPLSRFPPLRLVLSSGEERAEVVLERRSVVSLRRLAGKCFRRPVGPPRLAGRPLADDEDLRFVAPGAEVTFDAT